MTPSEGRDGLTRSRSAGEKAISLRSRSFSFIMRAAVDHSLHGSSVSGAGDGGHGPGSQRTGALTETIREIARS